MVKKYRKIWIRSLYLFVISICILGGILLISRQKFIDFLIINRPVTADLMIVEGWVDNKVLDLAAREYLMNDYEYLITTGNYIDSSYELSTNGLLEYQLSALNMTVNTGDTITIRMKGTPVSGIFPEVRIYLNDNKIAQLYASTDWNDYQIILDSTCTLNTLGMVFSNDHYANGEDRNLLIHSLTIDGYQFMARSEYVRHFKIEDIARAHPIKTNYHSLAAICAASLIDKGIPEARIIVLPSTKSNLNRTLENAKAVREWIGSQSRRDYSVNIVSESIHARRSYIIFTKMLDNQCNELGVFAFFPENESYLGNRLDNKDIGRELVGYFYYRFIFPKRKLNAI